MNTALAQADAVSTPALSVDSLRVWIDTPRGMVRAVDGIDLSVASGQALGIVGESGSGKSILSRAVMNILPPAGKLRPGSRIEIDGLDTATLSRAQARSLWGARAAMVFQDPMTSLTPVLTIGKQLTETLRQHTNLGKSDALARAEELLRMVGIPDPTLRLRQYPHNLSGGMRQRVVIALAIACTPRLLIADEPTTALDVTVQHQILDLLARLQVSNRMAMVLITHDLGVVAARTDHIAVMYAGKIVEYAPTRALFTHTRHPYTLSLLKSIPRLSNPSHTRLEAIPGRPPSAIDPTPGCAFAPRCEFARPRCIVETPPMTAAEGDHPGHTSACHYPNGTSAAAEAYGINVREGRTAAGLAIDSKDVT